LPRSTNSGGRNTIRVNGSENMDWLSSLPPLKLQAANAVVGIRKTDEGLDSRLACFLSSGILIDEAYWKRE
jgi:hypothetical protein